LLHYRELIRPDKLDGPSYGICPIEPDDFIWKHVGMVFTRRLEDKIRLLLSSAMTAKNGEVKPILSALRSALREHNSRLRALASRKLIAPNENSASKRRNET
jgi:hypothetical protein